MKNRLFTAYLLLLHLSAYATETATVLEIKIVCTNDPKIILEPKNVDRYLPNGKIVGIPFNTKHYKQCYILAKYNPTTPKTELAKAVEAIATHTTSIIK